MKKTRRNLGGTEYTTSNCETNTILLLLWLCGVITINCILTLLVLTELWKR